MRVLRRTGRALPAFLASLALAVSAPVVMRSSGQNEDAEDRAERKVLARRAWEENCLICHSAELTTGQRLTAAQWKTEVEKMVGWGAPVPADQAGDLIAYLAAEYPPTSPPAVPARLDPREALAGRDQARPVSLPSLAPRAGDSGASPERGAALYATHCANCHGTNGEGGDLGPIVTERPVLQRYDEFVAVTRDGRRRMPAYRAVLDDHQTADVWAWLYTRRIRQH